MNIKDVHVETGMKFQDRNGKDRKLTVKKNVHEVHPTDPDRYTYIDTATYTRTSNKLQYYYGGVSSYLQPPTGKRKAVSVESVAPSNVNGMLTETAYNELTPTPTINVNTATAKSNTIDVLSNYPNIVQFTLDTMQTTPPGVPDTDQSLTGAELAKKANAAYSASVSRFMPPATNVKVAS